MEEQENSGLSWVGRVAAIGALALALLVLGFLFLGRDDGYVVKARFQAATNVVKGKLVQVGGRKVGIIEDIQLADDGEAELTLKIDDDHITPLRSGTQATLRIASLSGSANRYVDLRIPPAGGRPLREGAVIDTSSTTSAVEVDQLFDLFDPETRKGLKGFIRVQANQCRDDGELANAGWQYVNPSLVAARRLFAELNYDSEVLQQFVVNSSKLVTDLADRHDDVARLVDQLAQFTGAIAREEDDLQTSLRRLPPFMRRANSTFVDLRGTLDELDPVVNASKPVTPKLRAVLRELRPFAEEAVPTVRDLSALVKSDGKDDDLIDLAKSVPPLRDIAVREVERNGKKRPGAFAQSAASLKGQTPHLAYFRPYVVDFTAWLDDFSHSGIYDANGSASRVATSVNAFAAVGGQLKLVPPELRQEIRTVEPTAKGQTNRCPGAGERPASDGSNPWKPTKDFNCDPGQVPPGK